MSDFISTPGWGRRLAQLARRRSDIERAAELITGCLSKLPGHREFINFAQDIGAPLPEDVQGIANQRRGS